MKIRTKIAFQFTLIVALILVVFSVSLYYLLEGYTKDEFNNYLKDRAQTTAKLLINKKNLDKRFLKIVDRNTLSSLYAAEVLVFNDENLVTYSNIDSVNKFPYSPEILEKIRKFKYHEANYQNKKVVGLMYTDEELKKDYLILAQAEDTYGEQKLERIKEAMTIGLVSSIFLTIIFGFVFAGQSLKPISRINQEVSKITARDLTKKLSTGNNKDEIAQLARNFNEMLSRIEKSFELQKSFVSNASHELRTPLAAIKSEIQVALEKDRTPEQYKEILKSLNIDNQRLIQLINGLLQLAKSEKGDKSLQMVPIRIDEILFEVQDELQHQHQNYRISIDFEEIPDDDESVTINGNKSLLRTLFNNLIDNACKYSENNMAVINIRFNKSNCIINVADTGIGISKDDHEKIFEPFFRTKNASNYKGHGIGLSICKRIVDIHGGRIILKSELGQGSNFNVILPHL
ncbi:sensor histidine kinase [Lacihabitans sp. CCS-44]|jgi:signal transduction histidine kinase|uniref:HAMP domain-containing sensor histidine kinase n=1 Tax=Lacihabitans sp. CCS-44 TaxID=2487331 RepID=UPI001B76342B|nr:HAMP domain-containing sensor histidine kinase [Lacihabitans sp. CCS-44]MBP6387013.1 HAMP domain-containing histidine kinase [Pseudarcicella sp.]MBP6618861.1 HAMP domain-containing histidine kinase [Leadbetterella sp.]MCP9757001.1 sensor histidine kinase [Lacihabitans sp. CCS-44]